MFDVAEITGVKQEKHLFYVTFDVAEITGMKQEKHLHVIKHLMLQRF